MDDQTLRILIDETIGRAVSQVRLPTIRFGTTVNTSDLDNVSVLIDGDIAPIYAPSLVGPLYDSVRVAVLFNPPSGALIVGYKYTGQILQQGKSCWFTNAGASICVGDDGVGGVGVIVTDNNGNEVMTLGVDSAGNSAIDIGNGDITLGVNTAGNSAINIGGGDITLGVDPAGVSSIKVMNDDSSAPVLDVSSGHGIFPPAIAPWVINNAFVQDAQGRPTHSGTAIWGSMLYATLPLTDADIDVGVFGATLSAGTCNWRLTVQTQASRPGHASAGEIVIATNNGYSGSGPPFVGTYTIPTSIWSPAANPVGSIVFLRVAAIITGGGGTATLFAASGVRCL